MYVQLDLKMISNLFKIKRRSFYFHEFWSEEVHYRIEKIQKEKTLMFEHHNHLGPIDLEAMIFQGSFF
jgi:hypothetical protein